MSPTGVLPDYQSDTPTPKKASMVTQTTIFDIRQPDRWTLTRHSHAGIKCALGVANTLVVPRAQESIDQPTHHSLKPDGCK